MTQQTVLISIGSNPEEFEIDAFLEALNLMQDAMVEEMMAEEIEKNKPLDEVK